MVMVLHGGEVNQDRNQVQRTFRIKAEVCN